MHEHVQIFPFLRFALEILVNFEDPLWTILLANS